MREPFRPVVPRDHSGAQIVCLRGDLLKSQTAGIEPGPLDSALSDYGRLPIKENRGRNAMTRTRQRVCNLVALPDLLNCASMHATVAGSGPRKRCANDTADSLTELLVG